MKIKQCLNQIKLGDSSCNRMKVCCHFQNSRWQFAAIFDLVFAVCSLNYPKSNSEEKKIKFGYSSCNRTKDIDNFLICNTLHTLSQIKWWRKLVKFGALGWYVMAIIGCHVEFWYLQYIASYAIKQWMK